MKISVIHTPPELPLATILVAEKGNPYRRRMRLRHWSKVSVFMLAALLGSALGYAIVLPSITGSRSAIPSSMESDDDGGL